MPPACRSSQARDPARATAKTMSNPYLLGHQRTTILFISYWRFYEMYGEPSQFVQISEKHQTNWKPNVRGGNLLIRRVHYGMIWWWTAFYSYFYTENLQVLSLECFSFSTERSFHFFFRLIRCCWCYGKCLDRGHWLSIPICLRAPHPSSLLCLVYGSRTSCVPFFHRQGKVYSYCLCSLWSNSLMWAPFLPFPTVVPGASHTWALLLGWLTCFLLLSPSVRTYPLFNNKYLSSI